MSIKVSIPIVQDSTLYHFFRNIINKAIDGTRVPLFVDENNQRVSVRTTTPSASAAFEVAGTTGAILLPRLTTTQRDALTSVNGMIIYNSSLDKVQVYEGGAWASVI